MDSPGHSQEQEPHAAEPETSQARQETLVNSDFTIARQPESKTPDPLPAESSGTSDTPSTPGAVNPYNWDDFEARYEKALRDADDDEREILKEASELSSYFQAWASAASAHDNERAAKRLQTRQRFVNLSEEKLAQRQQHYEEVVRAFESALALLRST